MPIEHLVREIAERPRQKWNNSFWLTNANWVVINLHLNVLRVNSVYKWNVLVTVSDVGRKKVKLCCISKKVEYKNYLALNTRKSTCFKVDKRCPERRPASWVRYIHWPSRPVQSICNNRNIRKISYISSKDMVYKFQFVAVSFLLRWGLLRRLISSHTTC